MLGDQFYKKLTGDLVWNISGLFVVGVSGLIMNFIIARYYGAEILGVFSQVLTIAYMVSQLGSAGVHFSVQKHIPEFDSDVDQYSSIFISALQINFVTGFVVAILLYFLSNYIGLLLSSELVSEALLWALPALFFIVLNKILLLTLNGLGHMRVYAIGQSGRVFLYLFFIVLCIVNDIDGVLLPLSISLSEGCIFFILFFYFVFNIKPKWTSHLNNKWIARHFVFARKSFFSGFLTEINPKVDILMLGVFLSDRVVGIYAFAAMIVEGVSQIGAIVRVHFNPVLVKLSHAKDQKHISELVKNSKKYLFPLTLAFCVLILLIYPFLVEYVVSNQDFNDGIIVLFLLMLGLVVTVTYSPFMMYLNQAGHPGYYTLFLFSIAIINLVLNYLIIPTMGMAGAAVATSASLLWAVFALKISVKRICGVSI